MWGRIINWFVSFYRGTSKFTPPTEVFQPPSRQPKRQRAKVDEDTSQAHYYFGDLVERLDNYFSDFEYLRRGNPDAAEIFEKFGVSVCSTNRLTSVDLEPSLIQQLPAQGCLYYGRSDSDDLICIRFMYFQKHHRPINVQHTNHTIYEIGGVWGIKERHCFQFYISVDNVGSIRVLKQIRPSHHTVGKGGRRNGGYNRGHIFRMEWAYPNFLREWLADRNQREKTNETIDEFASVLFAILANSVQRSESDMNVRVKKNGRVATFSINMLRTPYFFAEREKTKNENGNTNRILHIVRPHTRKGKTIKAHWRGERRFMWNGYDVSIGMPGKHFAPLNNLTAAAWEPIDLERHPSPKTITVVDAAKRIDEIVTAERHNAA